MGVVMGVDRARVTGFRVVVVVWTGRFSSGLKTSGKCNMKDFGMWTPCHHGMARPLAANGGRLLPGLEGTWQNVQQQWDFRFSRRRAAFWDNAPCSVMEVGRRFRGAYCLHHQGDEWLTMEAASTSETSVNFYQTTRRNIPEGCYLLSAVCRQHMTRDGATAWDLGVRLATLFCKMCVIMKLLRGHWMDWLGMWLGWGWLGKRTEFWLRDLLGNIHIEDREGTWRMTLRLVVRVEGRRNSLRMSPMTGSGDSGVCYHSVIWSFI
jgi:hypothetical protein